MHQDLGPIKRARAITPHDTIGQLQGNDAPIRALWIGVSGDVRCYMNGTVATFKNVPVGWLDIVCSHVYLTGTTASEILFCW